MADRILHDEECERCVLGSIMQIGQEYENVKDILTEDCFYSDFHKTLYKTIVDLWENTGKCDAMLVRAKLGGKDSSDSDIDEWKYLVDLMGERTKGFNISEYACHLSDLAVRRSLRILSQRLAYHSSNEEEDLDEVIDKSVKFLSDLIKPKTTEVVYLKKFLQDVYERMNENYQSNGTITGTPTGLATLDRFTFGLQRTDLIVVAGETSNGKTSFAVDVMVAASKAGEKVVMYSLELSGLQVAARMLSTASGVSAKEILNSKLDDASFAKVDRGVERIANLPILFDDTSTSSIDSIVSSIRFMVRSQGVSGAVIDYLQLCSMFSKKMNSEQQTAEIARRLKNLAKELDIWVILISQLRRDEMNPQPSMRRLRNSGQIEEAADLVILVYRPEKYNLPFPDEFASISTEGTALIDVAKGRNIGTFRFVCGYDARTTHFYDLENGKIEYNHEETPY